MKHTKFRILFLLFYFSLHGQETFAQITSVWESTINGNGDFGDQFHSIATDANNNSYAVGSTVNNNGDRDWLIIKYNAQASIQWKKTFSAPGLGPDEAKKVLIHPNGNIVVTGYGNNKAVGNDFWTMMLTPSGDTLWTDLYNAPNSNLYDEPNAMTFDAQGNIIITGESDQDPSAFLNNDFLTVKYNTTGNLQWAVKYNAPSNDNDRALSVCADASNNIYVTGRSFNGTDDDAVTIKYNASGTQQWLKTFDNGGIDRPVSIGIDTQSRIYVSMRSDNGTDDDYRLLQYNAQGVLQFNVVYDNVGNDRPIDMVVIPAGGCVITGRSDGNAAVGINYDVKTISYSATGVQNWLASYNGIGNNDDIPSNIYLASDGKVAVTGLTDRDNTVLISNDAFVLCYNSAGNTLISQTFNGSANKDDEGHAVSIGTDGRVVMVGFSSDNSDQRNAILLSYTSNAAPSLQNTWSGNGDNGQNVRDLVFDNTGNVYFCGYSVNKDNNRDFYIGKLNSAGNLVWSFDTTGTLFGSDEEANSILLDPSGNIIVSGYLKNAGTSSDIYVEKYNPAGTLLWQFGYDNTIHESDRAYASHLDNAGNIYLCGKKDTDASWQINDDILTLKINASGTLAWASSFTSSTLSDRGQIITVNGSNEVITGGRLQDNINDNIIIIKYSNIGNQVWTKTLDFHGGMDKLNDLKLDNAGNIFICGQTQSAAGSSDYNAFLCKINNSGVQEWVSSFDYAGQGLDEAIALEIGSDNSIWITGQVDTDLGLTEKMNVFIRKYDTNGNLMTTGDGIFSSTADCAADDIVLNGYNEPCVAMHRNQQSNGEIDYEMVLLTINGGAITEAYSRAVSDSIDVANLMKFSNTTSNIYLGGSSWLGSNQRDFLLGKYNWLTVGVDDLKNTSALSLAYPNPFSSEIRIINPQDNDRVVVYNGAGQMIFSSNHRIEEIETDHWSDGMYIIEMIQGNNKKKQSLIKTSK
ncbi:MAG: hypothetical protein RLY35_1316 [Bacteroidota bacterium]